MGHLNLVQRHDGSSRGQDDAAGVHKNEVTSSSRKRDRMDSQERHSPERKRRTPERRRSPARSSSSRHRRRSYRDDYEDDYYHSR